MPPLRSTSFSPPTAAEAIAAAAAAALEEEEAAAAAGGARGAAARMTTTTTTTSGACSRCFVYMYRDCLVPIVYHRVARDLGDKSDGLFISVGRYGGWRGAVAETILRVRVAVFEEQLGRLKK